MPINSNIPMSFQPPQIESPGNMMARMAQMQAMQDASEEKQLAIEQRRRLQSERGMLNKMLEASGYEPTPKVLSFMTGMLDPKMAEAGVQGLQQYSRQKGLRDLFAPPPASPEFSLGGGAPTNFLAGGEGEAQPLSVDTPNRLKGFAAPVEGNYLTPDFTGSGTGRFSISNERPNALAQTTGGSREVTDLKDMYQKLTSYATVYSGTKEAEQALQQARLIQDRIHHLTPKPETNPEIVKLQEQRKRLSPNDPLHKELTARINFLGTGPQQSASAADQFATVATIDNGNGTTTVVERNRLTGERRETVVRAGKIAKEPGALTARDAFKIRGQAANDSLALNTSADAANKTVSTINALAGHPGLPAMTGAQGYLFSIPGGDAANAEALLKELDGQVTALGKSIASSKGAIGSMAVQEWNIVKNMVSALDPKKGKEAFLRDLDNVKYHLTSLDARMRDRYETLYPQELLDSLPQAVEFDPSSTAKTPPAPTRSPPKAAAPKPAPAATGGGVDKNNPWLK